MKNDTHDPALDLLIKTWTDWVIKYYSTYMSQSDTIAMNKAQGKLKDYMAKHYGMNYGDIKYDC